MNSLQFLKDVFFKATCIVKTTCVLYIYGTHVDEKELLHVLWSSIFPLSYSALTEISLLIPDQTNIALY